MLSFGPSPRLLHGPPDVRSSLGSAGIGGEVVVFKGPFNPVLAHAISIRGDTECYISSGGPVLVLGRGSALGIYSITSVPLGRKRTFETPRFAFLLAGLIQLCYLLLEAIRHRVLLSGMAV